MPFQQYQWLINKNSIILFQDQVSYFNLIIFSSLYRFFFLGSTHNQIDEYAKKQSAKINEEIEREIEEVLARTRREQEELLRRANERTVQLDAEYRARLQTMIEEVDADKAQRITEIEKDLNAQQTGILESARNEIDRLNQKAANLKIGAIQQAQERATTQVNEITAQAAQLGQTSTVHHGKGTTTIKTEITGETTTKDTSAPTITAMASGTKATSETKTVETSRNQAQAIRK